MTNRPAIPRLSMPARALSASAAILILLGLIASPAVLESQNLVHFRLLVELETTAKRAGLTFEANPALLTSRITATSGPVSSRGWTLRRIWVRSSDTSAVVTVTATMALSAQALLGPLPFTLEKSSDGETTLRVSLLDRDGLPRLMGEWRHTVSFDLSGSIDLRHWPGPGLIPPPSYIHEMLLPQVLPAGLLLAFYYPWYSLGDWSSPYLLDEPLTLYASYERTAMARHVDQARSAGVGGFIASWWGPDDAYIDRNFGALLAVAAEKGFLVAPYLETIDYSRSPAIPRDENTLRGWLAYCLDRYGRHPAFLKMNGKPVIFVWVSFAVPLEVWDRIFRQLRAEGRDAVYIAGYAFPEPTLEVLDVFDGMHNYNILGIINRNEDVPDLLARTYAETGQAVRHYALLADDPRPRIWTASIQPGFDDHLLPGRQSPLLPRENGALYEATWNAAADSLPDWVLITTWNEYWENTHIEPSRAYGDQYLRMTGDFFRSWQK